MAQQTINVGTLPNDGTGDNLKASFQKCNNNFTELYTSILGIIARIATVPFTSSGTWTKQANLIGVQVEVWGAASGAGTAQSDSGGSGGGYARKWYPASALGSTVTVTIGAGGADSASAPGTGGTTTFAASAAVSATGGVYNSSGGSGSGGDINMTGQRGQPGLAGYYSGSGGNAPFMSGAGMGGSTVLNAVPNSGGGNSSTSGGFGASGYCIVTEYYSV